MAYCLRDKVALVTGAGTGIGAATARVLARSGANVVVGFNRAQSQAEAIACELASGGVRAVVLQADLSDRSSATALVHRAAEAMGRLDILVNNAGVVAVGRIDANEPFDGLRFDYQLSVNYTSVVAMTSAAATLLPRGGRIVTIGSATVGRTGSAGMAIYAGSKSALIGFTKGAARDLAAREITVNLIHPGLIDTDMNPADAPGADGLLPSVALGRFGRAEEVAAGVLFLASPEASYVTGTVLTIDGGYFA